MLRYIIKKGFFSVLIISMARVIIFIIIKTYLEMANESV